MTILIVAATRFEIETLLLSMKQISWQSERLAVANVLHHRVDILITGIGTMLTTYFLTKTISHKKYDLVINAGICGSFRKDFQIGDAVQVVSEIFGDLGIEAPDSFKTLFEMNFMRPDEFPFLNSRLNNQERHFANVNLKPANGLTVNTTHGKIERIELLKSKFDADVESMEGAAVFYVCLTEQIPFIEIRTISNYVEPRNKENWNIPLAIKNLNVILTAILDSNIQICK